MIKPNAKLRAVRWIILNGQLTVLSTDDLFGKCKTDSVAVLGKIWATVESFKDMRQIWFWNAVSCIRNQNLRIDWILFWYDGNLPALRGMLQTVFQNVADGFDTSFKVPEKNGSRIFSMDFQQDFNFFKPQISLITLIFNKLQILQIIQINFNAQAHKLAQMGWRTDLLPHKKKREARLAHLSPFSCLLAL